MFVKRNPKQQDLLIISPQDTKSVNFFWAGIIAYMASYVISTTGHVNYIACQLIQLIGIILFIKGGSKLIDFRIKDSYLRIFFPLYCLWTLTVLARGFSFNYTYLKEMIFGAGYGVLVYFAPLVLLFPKELGFYKSLFNAIIILGIISFAYDLLFIRDLLDRSMETQDVIEYFTKDLSITTGFILLTYKYHSKKRQLVSLAIFLISLLFSIYKARRGLSSICSGILFFAFVIYFFRHNNKIIIIYFCCLGIVLGLFYVNRSYRIKQKGMFSFILERAEEDTRTGVELYFYNDMQPIDWTIGRGINGKYYCPDIEESSDYRILIETGYLQIILKGGIILLSLYLLMAVPALVLGIFYSNNLLSKAAGIWIFVALLSLYPATVNTFNLNYLLVWISMGICYSGNIRRMPDHIIAETLLSSN